MTASFAVPRPFVRVPEFALQMIESNLELGAACGAKSIYLAICRICNNERKVTFTKSVAYVGALASLGRRTVERRLPELEKLGLVKVHRSRSHSRHLFTLITTICRNDTTLSRNNVATATSVQAVTLNQEVKKRRSDQSVAPNVLQAHPASASGEEEDSPEALKEKTINSAPAANINIQSPPKQLIQGPEINSDADRPRWETDPRNFAKPENLSEESMWPNGRPRRRNPDDARDPALATLIASTAASTRATYGPCRDDVRAYAQVDGIPTAIATEFFEMNRKKGWRMAGVEIANWRSALHNFYHKRRQPERAQ